MTDENHTYNGDVQAVTQVAALTRPGPYHRIWQPFIEQWRPQHLLVAYGQQLEGKTDMGDIFCSLSADDGLTWGYPVTVFDHRATVGPMRFAYANPVLYHPPDQDVVWCFAMRCPLNWPDSEDSQLCAAYSADGGRSWQPVELAMRHHSAIITCAGIVRVEREDGVRYLLPVHRSTFKHDPIGTGEQSVLESTSLLEWQLAGYVPRPPSGEVFGHEGNIAAGVAQGELKMVMRTARYPYEGKPLDPPVAFSSASRDGGRTWSTMQAEPELHNAVSKAYYGRDRTGNEIYVYSVGPAWQRMSLAYKLRRPGQAWDAERMFYDAGVHNSYPTLLEHAPGQFYAVWDSSTSAGESRTVIRFGRFVVDQVGRK